MRSKQVLSAFLAVCLCLGMTACMPSGNENVNTELFENKEEMRAKADELSRGMSIDSAMETLGVPLERFAVMSTDQVQTAVYGNSQVQGTPEQLEKFRKRLQAFEGYSLPYRQVKAKSSLGFGKVKVAKSGHDLQLLLIFENKKLLKATVVGSEELNKSEDKYLWNSLISRGVGSVF